MRTISFRKRILFVLLGILLVAQVTTMLAVLGTTGRAVHRSVRDDLNVAESVFERLFGQRFVTLAEAVAVLAKDFGFKSAIGTGDSETIASALENFGGRAGATLAMFVPRAGAPVVAGDVAGGGLTEAALAELGDGARSADYLFEVSSAGERALQIVSAPVMIPDKAGWLVMGFGLDAEIAREFKEITGLDVSIVANPSGGALEVTSTLTESERTALVEALELSTPEGAASVDLELAGETFATQVNFLDGDGGDVYAVLQKRLSDELAPWHALERQLVVVFFALLAVAAAVGAFFATSATEPIRRLAEAARRIGEGHYDTPIETDSGDEIGRLGETLKTMQREIAEREHRITHQAFHDELTGLPNRYLARDRLEVLVERARRAEGTFTVVMLDLARFKQINDTLGHHVGDEVLKETARRLSHRLRRTDSVARLGGDDFFLILDDADAEAARELIDAGIRAHISRPIALEGMQVNLDFCFGLATYPDHATSADALLRRAEIAMYDAKDSHEDTVVYRIGGDEGHLRQLAIISDLDAAMREHQLFVQYQPKIDLKTGRVSAAEALVRWVHPKFGFIPPDEFVTVLEQTGNVRQLTEWVIGEVVAQAGRWRRRGIDVGLSINLSTLDLLNAELPAIIAGHVDTHGVPPESLTFEITESAIMEDPKHASELLHALCATGHHLSIDDFGTGYSSLAQLKRLPVDELKIDKSFVLDIQKGSQDAVIVRSTVELAHSMGMQVVAEGVETAHGASVLREFACDRAQGYLFSKPLSVADFETWYAATSGRCEIPEEQAA